MIDEDAKSFAVDILKPKIYPKESNNTLKKKCPKRSSKIVVKPSDDSIRQFYFPIEEPIDHNVIKKEIIFLPYTLYSKQMSRDKRKQRMAVNVHERYKIISTDLRMRLHVPACNDPEDSRVKSDEKKHRVEDHNWVNNNHLYKSLKLLFNKRLSVRQNIGYRKDLILNIDANIDEEQRMYDLSFERYKVQVKSLDDFISNDFQTSKEFLTQLDQLKDKHIAKIVELQNFASEKNSLASKILCLDNKYRQQQYYGRFLYYLSLPSWRARHRHFARSTEIEAKGFDFSTTHVDDIFNVVFERIQRELWMGFIKPPLFFTSPSDLMQIFETIEKQELNHFIHVSQMEPQARMLRNAVKYLTDLVEWNSASVTSTIKYFEEKLQFCEDNNALLQSKFFKIINGSFYESVGAPSVLKLKLHLEFVYEQVLKEKVTNMDMITVARALEIMYIKYNKLLDDIHSDKVQRAVTHYMKIGRIKFKRAKAAARELRQFEILQQSLLRAHGPPSNKRVILETGALGPSKHNAKRPSLRKKEIKQKTIKLDLTEVELEYLRLFTEWTGHEDPSKYLHRSSVNANKSFDYSVYDPNKTHTY